MFRDIGFADTLRFDRMSTPFHEWHARVPCLVAMGAEQAVGRAIMGSRGSGCQRPVPRRCTGHGMLGMGGGS